MRTDRSQTASEIALKTLPTALVDELRLSEKRPHSVARGRSIVSEGQRSSSAYLIVEGWAVSKRSIGSGNSQIVDIMGPGSLIGLDSFIDKGPNNQSVTALQDLSLHLIDYRTLNDLADREPSVARWVLENLSRQVQKNQTHLAVLGQLPARGRLAFAMLRILSVAQQLGQPMVGQTIKLPITQEEIGNMLGLTNVSISKLMSAFRREGLIDYGRNKFIVKNVDALSKICGVEPESVRTLPSNDTIGAPNVSPALRSVQ